MDLSKVNINKPPAPAAAAAAGAGDQGKYEATHNTLYIGGLPVEWNNDQVGARMHMQHNPQQARVKVLSTTGEGL